MKNSVLIIILAFILGLGLGVVGTQMTAKNVKPEDDPVALTQKIGELQQEITVLQAKIGKYERSDSGLTQGTYRRERAPKEYSRPTRLKAF